MNPRCIHAGDPRNLRQIASSLIFASPHRDSIRLLHITCSSYMSRMPVRLCTTASLQRPVVYVSRTIRRLGVRDCLRDGVWFWQPVRTRIIQLPLAFTPTGAHLAPPPCSRSLFFPIQSPPFQSAGRSTSWAYLDLALVSLS